MDKEDELLLKSEGWTVECESPFEIRNEDGSFASEQAAQIVLSVLREELKIMTFYELPLGARFSYLTDSNNIWIKLSEDGCGLVAKYDDFYIKHKNWTGQQICTFADAEEELNSLKVILREG